jgi:glutamyl-tRNA synthetase
VKRELHYNQPEKGFRTLNFKGSAYIPKDDYDIAVNKNKVLRLMDLVNVEITRQSCKYDSESLEAAQEKHARIIQWTPTDDSIKACVVMQDNSKVEGFIESSAKELKIDDMVQLERFGFARVDDVKDDEITFYYKHN